MCCLWQSPHTPSYSAPIFSKGLCVTTGIMSDDTYEIVLKPLVGHGKIVTVYRGITNAELLALARDAFKNPHVQLVIGSKRILDNDERQPVVSGSITAIMHGKVPDTAASSIIIRTLEGHTSRIEIPRGLSAAELTARVQRELGNPHLRLIKSFNFLDMDDVVVPDRHVWFAGQPAGVADRGGRRKTGTAAVARGGRVRSASRSASRSGSRSASRSGLCAGFTASGAPCHCRRMHNSKWCVHHAPRTPNGR